MVGGNSKAVVNTRWALNRKMVDGAQTARARSATKGDQDPDLKAGSVDASGCVSPRSPRLRVVSLGALKKWRIWSLHIKNAPPQAAGFGRDVHLRTHAAWDPSNSHRIWKFHAPAVAPRRSLQKYLLSPVESLAKVGLEFRESAFDPRSYCLPGKRVGQLGLLLPTLMVSLGVVNQMWYPRQH